MDGHSHKGQFSGLDSFRWTFRTRFLNRVSQVRVLPGAPLKNLKGGR